jgi:sarcosine oxidase subunit delta
MPDPAQATDKQWAHYVFYEHSHIGVVREWWMHAPSSYWFIAERHNQRDEVLRTYDPSELFGQGEPSLSATELTPDRPEVS